MRKYAILTTILIFLPGMAALGAVPAASQPATQSAPAATQAVPAEVTQWLKAAENLCLAAKEGSPQWDRRDMTIARIALGYAAIGDVDKANRVAQAVVDERQRKECIDLIPIQLTHYGYVDRAVAIAKASQNGRVLSLIARISARKDSAKALAIASQIDEPRRSSAYAGIAEKQVLQGDLRGAVNTVGLITVPEERAKSEAWTAAGTLADDLGDIAKTAAQRGMDANELAEHLRDILKAKAARGSMVEARRILGMLPKPQDRASGLAAIAEYEIHHASKEQFSATLQQAARETQAIVEAKDDPFASFVKAAAYFELASLYIQAGDTDLGMKAISEYRRCSLHDPLGVAKGMGGDKAVLALYIEAGRMEEATKMAAQADGSLRPEALPIFAGAYAAKGQTAKVDELLKRNTSDAARCELYLSAAEGAIQRKRSDQEPK